MKWIISIGLLLLITCTENPFSDGDDIPERRIYGKIILEQGADNGDAFVWLEGTELITQTDADGHFEIKLPTPGDGGDGTIVSGKYNLYFYIANYELTILPIVFKNGEIAPNQKSITIDGELTGTVVVNNIFTIHSDVEKVGTDMGGVDTLAVRVTMVPNMNNVQIRSFVHKVPQGPTIRTGYLIFNAENTLVESYNLDEANIWEEVVMHPRTIWDARFTINLSQIPKGELNVVPYVVLIRKDVPKSLMDLTGSNYTFFNKDFIQYPMKRTGGKLVMD